MSTRITAIHITSSSEQDLDQSGTVKIELPKALVDLNAIPAEQQQAYLEDLTQKSLALGESIFGGPVHAHLVFDSQNKEEEQLSLFG